ncbi:MAG: hypothetical protein F9K18_03465 [Thermoanaerobaculia bacterium]|nr:MAG: hypothetical protein F9K18_03465 [Thermoanaerobaculia bacterium]
MERIAYFLGAGFSAPLGLPLTSNFLEKSKDLYFSDPSKYDHFKLVLETIAEMSVVKNYYATDLHNIEEILSILEMRQSLGGRKRLRKAFLRYIADVVNHYTPVFQAKKTGWPANWHGGVFSATGRPSQFFGYFVASLLGAQLEASQNITPIQLGRAAKSEATYSVITLNYDLVLEQYALYLKESFGSPNLAGFVAPGATQHPAGATLLTKLHGSADSSVIVPPTWNKSVARGLLPAWNSAFVQLSQATQIRFVGYSLPNADSYVKYLLRAAAIEAPHLKRIDVLCLDNLRGEVRARYDQFIDFPNYRFVSAKTEDYMEHVYRATVEPVSIGHPILRFGRLEAAHSEFFSQHSTS